VSETCFQRGFGLKAEVDAALVRSYRSAVVDHGLVVERLLALRGPGVSDLGLARTASTIAGCV